MPCESTTRPDMYITLTSSGDDAALSFSSAGVRRVPSPARLPSSADVDGRDFSVDAGRVVDIDIDWSVAAPGMVK
ncbi:MAG: hypothetical protein HY286_03020 [Planctomycetes bacterium]|nr:hypothetical protein [Planctomycetota bacterium]